MNQHIIVEIQNLLKEIQEQNQYIYPIIKDDSIIHASFHKFEAHAKPFPIAYDEYFRFVGGYVDENDRISLKHQNILKSYVHSSYKVYKL